MSQTPADPPRLVTAISFTLFILTALLFSPALRCDFVNYDDPDYVTANEHVKRGLTRDGIVWAFRSGHASNWHPLTWISHMADATLFKEKPAGHHATSVLLHAGNAVLAFLALRRLTGAVWPSAFFAALFAWHPLRVESVAWVAERKDVLSGFFGLATLWLYAVYVERRRTSPERAWRWYAMGLMSFALGLMAKPMLVTLPGVLLLLDVWPLRRIRLCSASPLTSGETVLRVLLEKLPFFALVVASSVVTYLVQKGGGSVSEALSLDARMANAVVAVFRYVAKFVWPSELAVLYPHPGSWAAWKVIGATAFVLTMTALALRQLRARPWIAVGWLWFLGALVPVIGLVQVGLQSMADRYTYFPILGVGIAVGWALREAARSVGHRPVIAAGGLCLVAFAVRTGDQLRVWKNSFTLFDHAIQVTRDNYLAHDNRGLFLFQAGKIDEALADYRRALAINPDYLNAHNNLGFALAQLGRPAEAIPEYRAALKADPRHLEVRNNLANALSDVGQLDEAMEHYAFVLARQPTHVNALNGSGVVLAMQNRLPEAKARLEESLRLAPDNASAHNNLGNVCSMLGLRDEAIQHYRRAAALTPTMPGTFLSLGSLLLQQNQFAEAAESFSRALALAPANPAAHAHLGFALAQLGRRDDARRELRTALQQEPGNEQAKAWLQAVEQMR